MGPRRASALGLVATAVLAQTPPPESRQAPVFPARVELVAIDATVVDGKGIPVSDLTQEDFEVRVDGKPRRVVRAEFLRLAPLPGTSAAAVPARSYSSNLDPPGRLIVIAPDANHLSTAGGRAATEAGRRFLDRLTPRDRVALVTLPVGPRVDFTTDHAKVREALAKVSGGGLEQVRGLRNVSVSEAFAFRSPSDRRLWNEAVSRECSGSRSQTDAQACSAEMEGLANQIVQTAGANTGTTIGALRNLMRALGRIDAPKTVVLLSQGLVTGSSMGQAGAERALAPVGDDAAAARVTLHTILIDRLFLEQMNASEPSMRQTPRQDQRLLAEGLEAVTGYAGGELYRVVVAADPGFDRIATSTSAGWLVSIEAEASDRDGKLHALSVKVAREKMHVRARPQFVASPQPAPLTPSEAVRRALGAGQPARGIPVALTTYVLGARGGNDCELVIAAEVRAEPSSRELQLAWRVAEASGKLVGGDVVAGPLPALPVSAAGPRAYYSTSLPVKPGRYVVSLAVADGAGRVGSLEHSVSAAFHAFGETQVSDLMLAEPGRRAGTQVALNVDGSLAGRAVTAYVELRVPAAAPSPAPGVRFEVAPAGAETPRLTHFVELQAEPDGRSSGEAVLDLASLPAGEYEISAVAFRGDATLGKVTRPLRLD